ncbi:MAG: hypothetical protein Kow0068_19770 [Marinilabiliales bacterium]
MKKQYIYGASIQGIQGFIFQTNKLKEIVGASQLVDNINQREFKSFLEKREYTVKSNNIILNAAGNIRYLFEEEDLETLKKLVLEFPKHITNYAPGVTISQAVVKIDSNLKDAIDDLERKLKAQRNIVQMPVDIGFMGLERARRTGGVGFKEHKTQKNEKEVIDKGTWEKIKMREEDTLHLFKKFTNKNIKKENVPFNIEDITNKGENSSWIAIIHADGNGLGNILQNMNKSLTNDDEVLVAYSTFSKQLEKATQEAAQKAFNVIVEGNEAVNNWIYPFRPVVLGGDDLTVIIRADLAYNFAKEFLTEFEKSTKIHFKELYQKFGDRLNILKEGLTACAGIAYIKDSYPFYYGVNLAEELTKKAKKFSKSKEVKGNELLPPSSLAFYKVQSSFTERLEDMIKRTHSINGKEKFFAGPYLTGKKINGYRTTDVLDNLLNILNEKYTSDKSRGISKIRQWISELHKGGAKADFMMDRIKEVNFGFYEELNLEGERKEEKTLLSDLIDLHTFEQIYKED